MNAKQKAALKVANSENNATAKNELKVNEEIKEIKKDLKDSKTFNDGQIEKTAKQPSANVETVVKIDLAKESRQVVKQDVKKLANCFDTKMSVLLKVCETPNGKNYLQQNNLKIEDITKKQVLKTLTSLVVNGKNCHVRIISLKDDFSNVLTSEFLSVHLGGLDEKGNLQPLKIDTVEIKYSVLDRNYIFEQTENNDLILKRGSKMYTFAIVETLPYNFIIDRLAKYRKIANIQATKLFISRQNEKLEAEKAEAKKIEAEKKAAKIAEQKAKFLATLTPDEIADLLTKKSA